MSKSPCLSDSNFYFLPTWSQSSPSSAILSLFTLDQQFSFFPSFGPALISFVCILGGLFLCGTWVQAGRALKTWQRWGTVALQLVLGQPKGEKTCRFSERTAAIQPVQWEQGSCISADKLWVLCYALVSSFIKGLWLFQLWVNFHSSSRWHVHSLNATHYLIKFLFLVQSPKEVEKKKVMKMPTPAE